MTLDEILMAFYQNRWGNQGDFAVFFDEAMSHFNEGFSFNVSHFLHYLKKDKRSNRKFTLEDFTSSLNKLNLTDAEWQSYCLRDFGMNLHQDIAKKVYTGTLLTLLVTELIDFCHVKNNSGCEDILSGLRGEAARFLLPFTANELWAKNLFAYLKIYSHSFNKPTDQEQKELVQAIFGESKEPQFAATQATLLFYRHSAAQARDILAPVRESLYPCMAVQPTVFAITQYHLAQCSALSIPAFVPQQFPAIEYYADPTQLGRRYSPRPFIELPEIRDALFKEQKTDHVLAETIQWCKAAMLYQRQPFENLFAISFLIDQAHVRNNAAALKALREIFSPNSKAKVARFPEFAALKEIYNQWNVATQTLDKVRALSAANADSEEDAETKLMAIQKMAASVTAQKAQLHAKALKEMSILWVKEAELSIMQENDLCRTIVPRDVITKAQRDKVYCYRPLCQPIVYFGKASLLKDHTVIQGDPVTLRDYGYALESFTTLPEANVDPVFSYLPDKSGKLPPRPEQKAIVRADSPLNAGRQATVTPQAATPQPATVVVHHVALNATPA